MLWWTGLTYIVNKMSNSFGSKGIRRMNHTIGAIVLVVAIAGSIMTLFRLHVY